MLTLVFNFMQQQNEKLLFLFKGLKHLLTDSLCLKTLSEIH